MLKTRVYLVRHGETDNNVKHRFIGKTDMPLNDRGQNQAKCLGRAMAGIPVETIYSSPLLRTMMTAEQIQGSRDIAIIPEKALAEIDCGMWEGLDRAEIQERWPGMIDLWQYEPERLQFPEGETFQQVQERAVEAFVRIVHENLGRTIVISTHMLPLQLIIAKLLNISIHDVWNMRRVENTSVTSLDIWQDGTFKILAWGDDSHLPAELRNEYVRVAGFVQPNFSAQYELSSFEGNHYSPLLSAALPDGSKQRGVDNAKRIHPFR